MRTAALLSRAKVKVMLASIPHDIDPLQSDENIDGPTALTAARREQLDYKCK